MRLFVCHHNGDYPCCSLTPPALRFVKRQHGGWTPCGRYESAKSLEERFGSGSIAE